MTCRTPRPSRADVSRALATDLAATPPPAGMVERLAALAVAAPIPAAPAPWWRRGITAGVLGGVLVAGAGASYATGLVDAPWTPPASPATRAPLSPTPTPTEAAVVETTTAAPVASDTPSTAAPLTPRATGKPETTGRGNSRSAEVREKNRGQDRAEDRRGRHGRPDQPGKSGERGKSGDRGPNGDTNGSGTGRPDSPGRSEQDHGRPDDADTPGRDRSNGHSNGHSNGNGKARGHDPDHDRGKSDDAPGRSEQHGNAFGHDDKTNGKAKGHH